MDSPTPIIIGWAVCVVLFLIVFAATFVIVVFGQFRIVRLMFSVELKPGEIIAIHRVGSMRVDEIRDKPGRYWRLPNPRTAWTIIRVDEQVFVASEPVQVNTPEGTTVILTVRLTMNVAQPSARYVVAVVGRALERWREQTLPILVTQAASAYSAEQVLNDRGQVARSIPEKVAEWFAGNNAADLGLSFESAAIIGANRPPTPRV